MAAGAQFKAEYYSGKDIAQAVYLVDATGVLYTGLGASGVALPAGSNLIGGVYVYDGAGSNKLAIDSSGRLTLVPNASVNVAQVGGSTLALGQAAMAASIPVVQSSDQTPKTSATATRTNVAAATSDTSLLASNSGRKGAIFFNDSTAILYLAYGSGAASTSSYTVQIAAGGLFELPPEPVFTGAIRGIWSAANGNVRITELS